MSIKLTDVAAWLENDLESTGFSRTDKRGYAVVDDARIPQDNPCAVILTFGNEQIRLTVTRER